MDRDPSLARPAGRSRARMAAIGTAVVALAAVAVIAVRRLVPPVLIESPPAPVTIESDATWGPPPTSYTDAPVLENRDEVGAALEREYPVLLRDAGIGGRVEVWARLSTSGRVEEVRINEPSGHPALDSAAARVAQGMEFTPALHDGVPVAVWVSFPVTFEVR